MDLLHWVVLTLAIIASTLVARENARDVPAVVWCFTVSSASVGALIGIVVRYRRNISRPSGLEVNCLKVNDSLIELHKPSGIPSVQVLFFHGLPFEKSSRVHLSTWECGDGSYNLWPQTWLVQEFPGAHVFVVRYDQGLGKDSRKTVDMKIIGENLLSDLMQGKIGQVQGCPVVLVGHSVGGLVIKQLCSEAHETLGLTMESRNARVQLENFLNNIRGIFFYATPHHGIRHIDKAAEILDSPLFKYFHTLSTEAERLNNNFSRLLTQNPKWQIKGLAESLRVKSGVFRDILVVPEASAREGDLNVETADHFSISKPPSKTSRRFNAVTGLLHNSIDSAKEDACPGNYQYVSEKIQGIVSPLQDVKERLKTVTRLCLTGMGGKGKTTLAKVVFNELAPKFEYTCFVLDVKSIEGNEEDLKEKVWKRMYHNGKKVKRESDWSKLRGKELLLVFDDISTERHTNALSEIANGSSSKSRFLATSRDHSLIYNTYDVPFLNADYAHQLFVSHAFPDQVTLPGNLASLVGGIVKKCEGLPLTLEVVGKYLRGRPDEEDWKQALDALRKADVITGIQERLWEKLKVSYNGLQENEKQIFLDSTTFFSVHYRTLGEAKMAWRGAYDVRENLVWRTLVERSLVYDVKENDVIKVHEQLRSLGRKIASESNDKRRVLEDEGLELLQSPTESEKQNLHSLVLWSRSLERQGIHVASTNLSLFKNLRYLEVSGPLVIEASLEDKWFPRNLVLLKCIGLQLFDPARQSCLAILELYSINAEYLPNSIGQLSGLRVFKLCKAPKLRSLPDALGQLSQLERLTLSECPLETLPETFGQLSNLKHLVLLKCYRLRTLPDSFGKLSALHRLSLTNCGNLQTLPESFGRLGKLTDLDIYSCEKFHSLPETFGDLCALVKLKLEGCYKLESLPDSFGNLATLSDLWLTDCGLQSLPESFGNLITLSRLELLSDGLRNLPESFGNLIALSFLWFSSYGLQSLPESFGTLIKLSRLTLECRDLLSLPKSFGKLIALTHLTLEGCTNLQSLPESLGQLAKLEYLGMSKAYELEKLPNSLAELNFLTHLIIYSTSIKSIPDYIRTLPSLQTLKLRQLPYVKELPPWLGETGQNSLACSEKIFQVREQDFSLMGDTMASDIGVLEAVHARFMGKVMKSDYAGALAALSVSNLGEARYQGFVLIEKGIVKRMMGDLPGALEDLTAALEIFSKISKIEDRDCYIYDCWKHRGYVNFLMGNLDSAESDGMTALNLQPVFREDLFEDCRSTLSEEQVTYMHFKLERYQNCESIEKELQALT